jgi:hypothetical protein
MSPNSFRKNKSIYTASQILIEGIQEASVRGLRVIGLFFGL